MAVRSVTRTKAQARTAYNRISRLYDAISNPTEKKYREAGLRMLAARPGERILEIGYGTGHSLIALAKAVGDIGKVLGVDISDGMYAIARQRVEKAGVADVVELHQGDALQLHFPPMSLDAVFLSFTLELFDKPEIPQVLKQCLKVLKPGGRLVVVSLAKKEQDSRAVIVYEWLHERMPAAIDCRPIYAEAALRSAGFEICRIEAQMMFGLPVEIILAQKP
jgi:ubiquinone/menaquinone biosynthesis C-methylase UbiE